MRHHGRQRGFTLLEAIIYIALFMFVIGGGVLSAYQIFDGSAEIKRMNIVEAEANFLQRKFDWALNGSDIVSPTDDEGSELVVDKGSSQYTFSLDSGVVYIYDGTGDPEPLSTDNITVSNLVFVHTPASGGMPESLMFSFSIDGRAIGTTTRYVR